MIARFAIPFFITVGFIVLPLLLFLLCRKLLPNKRYGTVIGIMLAALEIALVAYGMTGGFQPLEVHHIEYASADLPEAFDGYRIVQFSDVHVGTMTGSRQPMVQELIDSINAQTPDLIVFTGDMQNIQPEEMIPPMLYFRQLLAHDGVYAVLGNHDYAVYQTGTEEEKASNCELTKDIIRKMGFDLLLNEHRIIHRDSDSIVLAGMENFMHHPSSISLRYHTPARPFLLARENPPRVQCPADTQWTHPWWTVPTLWLVASSSQL